MKLDTLRLTTVDNFTAGDVVDFDPDPEIVSGFAMRIRFEQMQKDLAHLVIQHVDRERGVITYGLDRTTDPVRLAGCTLGREPPTGITVAVAAVASTILALEYLRRRKQLVAAEDPQSVIADFVAWFERWMAGLREMLTGRGEP